MDEFDTLRYSDGDSSTIGFGNNRYEERNNSGDGGKAFNLCLMFSPDY